jgi:Domain of unknown function (DUF384).
MFFSFLYFLYFFTHIFQPNNVVFLLFLQYPVLREFDKAESDEQLKELCLELVNFMILDESDGSDRKETPNMNADQTQSEEVKNDKKETSSSSSSHAEAASEIKTHPRVQKIDDGIEEI